MLSIRSSADLARAFNGVMDPALRKLLTTRRDQWLDGEDYDLGDLVHVIVVQHGDTLGAVEAEAGLALTIDDDPFEFVRRTHGWLEAVLILSDDGFGVALFVPDLIEIDPAITLPLRRCCTA